MQRTTPPTGTASPKSPWPPVAVPGQPDARRSGDRASDAQPVTTDTPLPVTDHHVPRTLTAPGHPVGSAPTTAVALAGQPDRSAAESTAISVTPTGLTTTTKRVTGSPGHPPVSDPVAAVEPVGPPGQSGVADAAVPEGAGLLTELRSALTRYVILPSREAEVATTLWIAATHLQPAWQHAPRLAVVGPAKRCGKSRLLDVLHETVHDPFITVNSTPAAIFRSITEKPPTLLVDEVDTIFGSAKAAEKNEEMRGLLNAGHQRNRPTTRVAGPDHKPTKFPTFAMAALAGIGDLPDTIMDRAVVVRMRRRAPGEEVRPFRSRWDTPPLHALRDRLVGWLTPLLEAAARMAPPMPVDDRAADTWEPLVIVADLAGGDWPHLARTACTAMTAHEAGQDEEGGLKSRILADIRAAFAEVGDPTALPTEHLLMLLHRAPEGPWTEYGTSGLTPRGLQLLLKDYGIGSANIRFADGNQRKGFARNQFLDAWTRYCPEPTAPAPHGS